LSRRTLSVFVTVLLVASILLPISIHPVQATGWYDSSWLYRKSITIDHSKVPSTLNNFPVLVSITDSDLASHARTDGYDILFTASDGSTVLSHERESYSSGTLVAWVNVPTLSSSTDTVLYMYYGNSGHSTDDLQNKAGVWDSSKYMMVQHLTGTSYLDSTSHGNNGAATGTVAEVAGKIGNAASFSSSYVTIADSTSLNFDGTTSFSYTYWFYTSVGGGSTEDMISKKSGSASLTDPGYKLVLATALGYSSSLSDGTNIARLDSGSSTYITNAWAMLTVVVDRTNQKMFEYLNGVPLCVNSANSNCNPDKSVPINTIGSSSVARPLYLAATPDNGPRYYAGLLDEVNIVKTALSQDWITTSYNSMNSPSTFFGLGSEETSGAPSFDFSISNSGGITVAQGGSGSNTITATLASGSTQSVDLSCTSGLPTGASCGFSPASGSPTFSSTLTISTTGSTPVNSYTITVTGTGGGKSHDTQFQLTVNAAPPEFDFSLGNSGGITVTQGGSGFNTITATLTSGSTASVSLSCTSGLPSGASCGFSQLSGNPTFSSTLTISTLSSTPVGSPTITVTGTGGGQTHTTTFMLTVNPPSAFDPWANGWSYRRSITVDHTKVSAPLTNFPVLVDITSVDLKPPKVRSDAYDILFMDGAGSANKLDHEIELYDSGTGHLVAWVKIPNLSSTTDTIFYLYYGNSGASNQQNPAGVWDSSTYMMVQHLTGGTHLDSTTHGNNGAVTGGVTQVAGKIGGADSFDGTSGYVSIPDSSSLNFGTGSFSLTFWVNSIWGSSHTQDLVGKKTGTATGTDAGYKVVFSTTDSVGCSDSISDGTHYARLDTGTCPARGASAWYMYTVVVDRTQQKMITYINGDPFGSPSPSMDITSIGSTSNTHTVNFGATPDNAGRWFYGMLDEVRIVNIPLTPDWIKTSYNSMNSPSTFYSVSVEQVPVSTVVTLNVVSPQYYMRGATVSYSGTVSPSGTVGIVVKDHNGVSIWADALTPVGGVFSSNFMIGAMGGEGLCTIYASSGDGSAQTGFYLDVSAPASSVSIPAQGSTVNSIPVISGVASDPNLADGNPGSGVSSVMITLQRVTGGLYWTGSAWGSLTWLAASYSAGSWSYDSSGVGWMAGSYTVVSKAADVAGNVETPGAGNTFTFSGWISVGGVTPSRPAACYFNSHLYTIVRDNGANPQGSALWMSSMDSTGTWSSWSPVGGLTPSAPACAVFNSRLYLFVRDAKSNLWMSSMNTGEVWSSWTILTGSSPSSPAAAAFNGYLYLAVRGSSPYANAIWLNRMDTSESWNGWTQLSGLTPDSPSLAAFNNHLYMVVEDVSGGIWVRSMDSAEVWSGWTNLNGVTSAPPSMAAYGDHLYLFVRDISGGIWSNSMGVSGTWSGWQSPGGLTTSGPVGCATDTNLYVIVNDVVGGLWAKKIV